MNILQANVKNTDRWWQCELLQLEIIVEGETEQQMIEELEHRLKAEYVIALRAGRTPFVDLYRERDAAKGADWDNDHKKARALNLPEDVRKALAGVTHMKRYAEIQVSIAA